MASFPEHDYFVNFDLSQGAYFHLRSCRSVTDFCEAPFSTHSFLCVFEVCLNFLTSSPHVEAIQGGELRGPHFPHFPAYFRKIPVPAFSRNSCISAFFPHIFPSAPTT